ncbi:MAG: TldD/PmbA family protein [Deltaproteobacteria bacterium]|nr:TldD/PmbA family protein [Deltaproteobacteria bacterium]
MLLQAKARAITGRVLARIAKTAGATARVRLSSTRGGYTRFAVNTVTAAAETEDVTLSVTIALGQRAAEAATNQLDDGALDDVVARALRFARLVPENPEAMAPLGAQRYGKGPTADPHTARAAAVDRAPLAQVALDQARAAKVTIAGFIEHAHESISLASSAGLWAHHESTRGAASCSARTPDATGAGWAGAVAHRLVDLDGAALARVAIDKAQRSAQPKKLEPGRYTVILEPAATASLVSFVIGALDAREADEGRSCFSTPGGGTRIGEKLFPDTIVLRSDPTDAPLGARPFDDAGVPLAPRTWIDRGALTGLVTDPYWAQHQHRAATGAPNGWSLAGGGSTREALIAGVKRGVLITRFWYLGLLDPRTLAATGLTRDGVFLIEDGAIAGPVNNFRFNQSALDVLASCDALGQTAITRVDAGFPFRAPWLRTHDFNLASISEAV